MLPAASTWSGLMLWVAMFCVYAVEAKKIWWWWWWEKGMIPGGGGRMDMDMDGLCFIFLCLSTSSRSQTWEKKEGRWFEHKVNWLAGWFYARAECGDDALVWHSSTVSTHCIHVDDSSLVVCSCHHFVVGFGLSELCNRCEYTVSAHWIQKS